eukprot:Gb_09810 [translate_table: standard]
MATSTHSFRFHPLHLPSPRLSSFFYSTTKTRRTKLAFPSPSSPQSLTFSLFRCSTTSQQFNDGEEKNEKKEPINSTTKSVQTQTQQEENSSNNVGIDDQKKMQPSRGSPVQIPDSTDWIASFLTRKFGLRAGIAWVLFLAIGVISEQIKTRFEVSQEQQNMRDVESAQEVVLPNKIKYVDLRVGGGPSPRPGELVVIALQGKVQSTGYVFVDTFSEKKRPLAFLFGAKPYTKGICEGLEYVIQSMKTGGKRRATIPPELGFGEIGADLGEDILIPPGATLEYVVELQKVSIRPF